MSETFSTKRYPIVFDETYGIFAGRFEGQQTIVHVGKEGYQVLRFSDEGDLIATDRKPYLNNANDRIEAIALGQMMDHGTPIYVKKFFLETEYLGIQDMPEELQEVSERPEIFEDEERDELLQDLKLWQKSGQFILQWDKEFFMNSKGEVVSS